MFTAAEMNRISHMNFEVYCAIDLLQTIEDEMLYSAACGKKYTTVNVSMDRWGMDNVRNTIQFVRNRGYDVKFANDRMTIRW